MEIQGLEYLVDTQLVAQESGGEILDRPPKKWSRVNVRILIKCLSTGIKSYLGEKVK